MTYSKLLLAGAAAIGIAATAAAPASAAVLASLDGFYDYSDNLLGSVTNTSAFTETNVTVSFDGYPGGPYFVGTLAAGASTGFVINLGDTDFEGGATVASLSVDIGGQTFTSGTVGIPGIFVYGDNYGATANIATVYGDVPEPASMALVGAGLLGLGMVRRRKA